MIYRHRLHRGKDKQSVDMFHDMYSNRENKEEGRKSVNQEENIIINK